MAVAPTTNTEDIVSAEKKKTGRPKGSNTYTPEVGDMICERIANGESLRSIVAAEKLTFSTIMRWVSDVDSLRDQYARAREQQAEGYASDIVTISDSEPDPAKARVRVDARKWVASKLLPKKYGDKVAHEHGGTGGGPITFSWLPPQS